MRETQILRGLHKARAAQRSSTMPRFAGGVVPDEPAPTSLRGLGRMIAGGYNSAVSGAAQGMEAVAGATKKFRPEPVVREPVAPAPAAPASAPSTGVGMIDRVQDTVQKRNALLNSLSHGMAPAVDMRRGTASLQGPGTGTSDSIPAKLSAGEAVLPKRTVQAVGADNIAHLIKHTTGTAPARGLHQAGHYVKGAVDDVEPDTSEMLGRAAGTAAGGAAGAYGLGKAVNQMATDRVASSTQGLAAADANVRAQYPPTEPSNWRNPTNRPPPPPVMSDAEAIAREASRRVVPPAGGAPVPPAAPAAPAATSGVAETVKGRAKAAWDAARGAPAATADAAGVSNAASAANAAKTPWYKPSGFGMKALSASMKPMLGASAALAVGQGVYEGATDTKQQRDAFEAPLRGGVVPDALLPTARYLQHIGNAVPGVQGLARRFASWTRGDGFNDDTPDAPAAASTAAATAAPAAAPAAAPPPPPQGASPVTKTVGLNGRITYSGGNEDTPEDAAYRKQQRDDLTQKEMGMANSMEANRLAQEQQARNVSLTGLQWQHDTNKWNDSTRPIAEKTQAQRGLDSAERVAREQNQAALQNHIMGNQTLREGQRIQADTHLRTTGMTNDVQREGHAVQREGNMLNAQSKNRQLQYEMGVNANTRAVEADKHIADKIAKSTFAMRPGPTPDSREPDAGKAADLQQFMDATNWTDANGRPTSLSAEYARPGDKTRANQAYATAEAQFGLGNKLKEVLGASAFGKNTGWAAPQIDWSQGNGIRNGTLEDIKSATPPLRAIFNSLGWAPGVYGKVVTFNVNGKRQVVPVDLLTNDKANGGQVESYLQSEHMKYNNGARYISGALGN